MIYVYRTVWVIGTIPVFLFEWFLFYIGLLTYPMVSGIYYIIHGTNDDMKWKSDTMADFVCKKYSKIKELIEK
jgi:hypothetical protein